MTAHRVNIRVAVSGDIASLIELDSISQRDPRRAEFIKRAVVAAQCWVATEAQDDSSIIGYGVLNEAFFEQNFVPLIVVGERARRKGVGSAILRELVLQCRGVRLFTSTNASNAPMRALLLQCGFVESGHVDNLDEGDPELIFVSPAAFSVEDEDAAIPPEDLYLIHCQPFGTALELRFKTGLHLDAPPDEQVLRITLAGLENAPACADFFLGLMCETPVYLRREGNTLTATTSERHALAMSAGAITTRYVPMNQGELRREREWVYDRFLTGHRNLTNMNRRIDAVRELTAESIKRVELKASSHLHDGTASVLYGQQIDVLKRILLLLDE